MRAPESLIPVLEQLCTVLEQLCRVEADKLTVVSADHPDQLESLLNDENMLLLQLRGLDKKRSDLLRKSGLEGLTFRQILMQEDSEEVVALLSPILEHTLFRIGNDGCTQFQVFVILFRTSFY